MAVRVIVEATAVSREKAEVEAAAGTGNEVLQLPAARRQTIETTRQLPVVVAVDNGLVARHHLPNLPKDKEVVEDAEVEEDEAVALPSLMVPSRLWSSPRMDGDPSRIHPHWLSQKRKLRRF